MLKVAIVGAGPAGFFAAAELLRKEGCAVDVFDRLPAPFGLVRHGVAPDHPAIKSVTERYDAAAKGAGARFRLLGNVEVGRSLALDELRERYHAVVLAYGAQSSRRLGIDGEDLAGVYSASEFVGWYNGHPDCAAAGFDLSARRAVVVGVGNVALDVARILLKPLAELARTDISDLALSALALRDVEEVVLLGRQGPAQAAFTPPELAEMAQIDGADLVIAPEDRELDPETDSRAARGTLDPLAERKLKALARAQPAPRPGRRIARVRFWTSPVEIVGRGRVEGVRVRRNRLVRGPDGLGRLEAIGQSELVECGLVFRSIGYRVQAFQGVPFDSAAGVVPHRHGQVMREGVPEPGLFVTGWAKRGPRGVIGSNKPDAQETARCLLEAYHAGALPPPRCGQDVEALLSSRKVPFVSYPEWQLLDSLEVEAGRAAGRPRRKFTDAPSMLRALAEGDQGDAERAGGE
ncbi:MAG: FAD-dependent oxidoreductase [Deltaproteobacteria bacterium]|nr:FAD-dependent oxidoreductase [Deltaproteobacteria bacterium]